MLATAAATVKGIVAVSYYKQRHLTTLAPRRNRLVPAWGAFVLLAAAFVLKAVVLSQLRDHPLLAWDAGLDTTAYVQLAHQVLRGNVGLGPGLYYVSPFYIYFLAAILGVLDSMTAVRVVQIAMGTASIGFVFLMAREWFGERAAWIAASLAALTGLFTFYEVLILQSSVDVFFTAAALYCLTRAVAQGFDPPSRAGLTACAAAGLVWGIQTLNRPNVLIAVLGIAFVMIVTLRRVKPSALLVAGLLAGMAPVAIRNVVVAGEWTLVSSHGGLNFYIGNNADATGFYRPVPGVRPAIVGQEIDTRRIATEALGHPATDAEASSYFFGLAWTWIREHPLDAAALFVKKFAFTFHAVHLALPQSYAFFAYDTAGLLRWLFVGPWLLVPLGLIGAALRLTTSAAAARPARSASAPPRPVPLGSAPPRLAPPRPAPVGSAPSRPAPSRPAPSGPAPSGPAPSRHAPSCPSPPSCPSFLIWFTFVPAYAAAVALFFVADRYRLPLMLPLAVCAGGAIDIAVDAVRAARPRQLAMLAGAFAVLLAAVNYPVPWIDDGRWTEGLRTAERMVITQRFADAERWASWLEEHSPPHAGAGQLGVGQQFMALNDYERALPYLTRAHQADPNEPHASYALGQALLKRGHAADAVPLLHAGFEAGIELPNGGEDYARALVDTGDLVNAAAALRRIHLAETADAEAWLRLGRMAMEAKAPDAAEPFFRRAAALQPADAAARQQYGLDLLVLNRFEEAARELGEAARLNPRDADTLSRLAYAEAKIGRTAEARQHALAALAIDPNDQLASQLLALLR